MEFVVLLLINLAVLALMYLSLRYYLIRNYSQQAFLERLEKEVNGIVTDMNRAAEMNVQLLGNEAEKLRKLQNRVQAKISEMETLLSRLEKSDSRYNDLIQKLSRPLPADKLSGNASVPGKGSAKYDSRLAEAKTGPGTQPENTDQPDREPANVYQVYSGDPDMNAGTAQVLPSTSIGKPDSREQIKRVLGLYNQGRSCLEISEITRLSLGEVELIVDMNR